MTDGVITESERFSPHGPKQQSNDHKDTGMLDTYDHDAPVVETAKMPDFSGHFSGVSKITKKQNG